MPRKSISNYPKNWKDIALCMKCAAGWKCVRCGHVHDPENGYTLTVHHLDLNPANNEWWNLPALCQHCHLHIQSKVFMKQIWIFDHSEWFKPYVAGYYAKMNNCPTDKEWVIDHINYLLTILQVIDKHAE